MSERKWEGKEGKEADDAKMDIDPASSSSSSSSPPPYRLSAQLFGHDSAVRDVAICDSTLLATCEERGKMRIFTARPAPSSSPSLTAPTARLQWSESPVFPSPVHLSLAFVVECVRDRSSPSSPSPYPPATFISGGGDHTARPFTSNGSLLPPLSEHPKPVNSIAALPSGLVATGCWDGVVRVWDGPVRLYDVVGHEHATEVLSLPPDDLLVSASANRAIHLIRGGKVVKRVEAAHGHSIRKLIAHPLGFASAANDGLIKVWSRDGEELQCIQAHTSSEVKFIYGLALIPATEELVSCGDDGQVKVWRGGECVQVLRHPGAVRAVKAMENGDLVTACADRVARIWTREEGRMCEAKEREEYEETMGQLMLANMEAIEPSTLVGEEALTQPGTKDGQVLVVNAEGKGPTAYQWSDDAQTWVEVGSVMGKSNKQSVDGVEYDSVTTVFVSETQSVKLGVNRDDDPYDVADRFCDLYDLPADAKQQIVAHVRPLTDELAVAERKRREKEEAERTSLRQVPGWRQGGLEVFRLHQRQGHEGQDRAGQ